MVKGKALMAVFTVLLAVLLGTMGLTSKSYAQDPGTPDSLIIGNFDGTPILAGLNAQITVPVYIRTDDSVTFIHVPVATDDDYVATRGGGVFYPPLTLWDDKSFLNPDLNSPSVGHTSQSFLGFAYLFDPRDPQNFLYTNNQWVHIADFRLTTTDNIAVLGDTTFLIEGNNPANGGLIMGLQDGLTEIRPVVVWGSLYFPPNAPPTYISPIAGTFPVNEQFGAAIVVEAVDPDTDSIVLTVGFGPTDYTLQQVINVPGHIKYNFNWVPGPGSAGSYPLTFTINDGNGGVVNVDLVLEVTPAGLVIESLETLPGTAISVPVTLNNQGSSSAVGAFEILINWNPEALTLNGVTRAGRLGSFEYFRVNYNDAGDGSARITGIADIRNNNISPPLQPGDGAIFFLEMSVLPDESLIGVDLPVTFLNLDQTDNTLSDSTGYLLVHPELTNGIITVVGPQNVLTGDINLNGIPYESGDVVLFVNHLTYPSLFPFSPVQREASDVNADGIPETVADLVYLINIVNGSIPPPPRIDPNLGSIILTMLPDHGRTIFTADSPVDMGAILIKISHLPGFSLTPINNSAFTLAYNDDGQVLTVLAYLPNGGKIDAGRVNLFTLEGATGEIAIEEISASDAIGNLINIGYRFSAPIPETYELAQNYPNPFNATTQISFGLPEAADVRLDVYNITGQIISTIINGRYVAGRYNIIWNGLDGSGRSIASGVYFYRLNAGSDVKTMKMTLLK